MRTLLFLFFVCGLPLAASASEMSIVEAAILGLVEGLTEYLPVSSTGHLILAQRAMGIGVGEDSKLAADAYAICIQAGAILAVLGIYFGYIKRMVLGLFGRDAGGRKMLINTMTGVRTSGGVWFGLRRIYSRPHFWTLAGRGGLAGRWAGHPGGCLENAACPAARRVRPGAPYLEMRVDHRPVAMPRNLAGDQSKFSHHCRWCVGGNEYAVGGNF